MRRPAIFFCLAALLGGPWARATLTVSSTWSGSGGNSSLSTSGNWIDNTAPATGGAAALIFGTGATSTAVNVGSSFSSYGLSFTGGSYSLTGGSGATLGIDAGGITAGSSASLDSTVGLQLTANQTWDVSSTLTVGSTITGSFALTKTDTGTLNLSGNNSFSGGFTLSGGVLQVGNNGALGSGTVTLNGGALAAVGPSTTTITLPNNITLGNNVVLNGSSATTKLQFNSTVTTNLASTVIQLVSNDNPVVFTGALTGQTAGLTDVFKNANSSTTPSGIAVLGGSSTNLAEIDASNTSVVFLNPGALPSTKVQATAGGYVSVGDGFNTSTSYSPSTLLNLITDKGNFTGYFGFDTVPGSPTNTFSGTIDLTNFTNAGFFGLGSLTEAVIADSAVIKPPSSGTNAGVLQLTAAGGGTLTVSAPLLSSNGISSVIIGNSTNSNASGTVLLANSGDNYSGGTSIQSGSLLAGDNGALGTGTISTTVGSSYPLLAAATPGITLGNSFNLLGNGLVVGVDGAHNGLTLTGPIAGTGILGVHDTTTLSNNNTVAGIIVDQGASLNLATDAPASATGTFNVQWGSVAFTSAGAAAVIGTLSGTTSGSITFAPAVGATLTINQTSDATYYGTINQASVDFSGSIVKSGGSRLFLDGTDVYSGSTTISEGTLIADTANAFGTSTIVLDGGKLGVASGVTLTNPISFTANGGKLGGLGTIAPTAGITIGSNIIIAPGSNSGNGPGKLTFGTGGLTLASGGTIHWQIQSVGTGLSTDAGTLFDTIVVNGPVNVSATSGSPFFIKPTSLDSSGNAALVGDFNSNTAYSWLLLSASGGISSFDPSDFSFTTTSLFLNPLNGGAFSLSLGGTSDNELFLNFTPVPEPSEYLLMATGLGLIWLGYRRRKRSAARAATASARI